MDVQKAGLQVEIERLQRFRSSSSDGLALDGTRLHAGDRLELIDMQGKRTLHSGDGIGPATALTDDGQKAYFEQDKIVYQMSTRGGSPQPLVELLERPAGLDVAPDGKTLALATGKEVYTWRPEQGSQVRHLLHMPEEVRNVDFLSDGSLMVFTRNDTYHYAADGKTMAVFSTGDTHAVAQPSELAPSSVTGLAGPVHGQRRWSLAGLIGAGTGLAAGVAAYLAGLPPTTAAEIGAGTALLATGAASQLTQNLFPAITRADRTAMLEVDAHAGGAQTYKFGSVRQSGQSLEVDFASGWRLQAEGIGDKPDILSLPEHMCYGEAGRALGQRNAAIPHTTAQLYGADGFPREAMGGDPRRLKVLYDGNGVVTVQGVRYDLNQGSVESDWLKIQDGRIQRLVLDDPSRKVKCEPGGVFSSGGQRVGLPIPPEAMGDFKLPEAVATGQLATKRHTLARQEGLFEELTLVQQVRRPPTEAGEWLEATQEEVVSSHVEARFASGSQLSFKNGAYQLDGQPVPGKVSVDRRGLVIEGAPLAQGDVITQVIDPEGVRVVREGFRNGDHRRLGDREVCDAYSFLADGGVDGEHLYPAKGGGYGSYAADKVTVEDGVLKTGMLLAYFQYSESDIKLSIPPGKVIPAETQAMATLLGPELRRFSQALLRRRSEADTLESLAGQLKLYAGAVPDKPELGLQLVDLARTHGQATVERYLQELIVARDPAARLTELLQEGLSRTGISQQGERLIIGGTVLPTRQQA